MPKGHYLVEAVKHAIWGSRAEGVSERLRSPAGS